MNFVSLKEDKSIFKDFKKLYKAAVSQRRARAALAPEVKSAYAKLRPYMRIRRKRIYRTAFFGVLRGRRLRFLFRG